MVADVRRLGGGRSILGGQLQVDPQSRCKLLIIHMYNLYIYTILIYTQIQTIHTDTYSNQEGGRHSPSKECFGKKYKFLERGAQ